METKTLITSIIIGIAVMVVVLIIATMFASPVGVTENEVIEMVNLIGFVGAVIVIYLFAVRK